MSKLHSAAARVDQWVMRSRGFVFGLWVRLWGGRAGLKILVDRRVRLRHPPGPGWSIGDNVYIGNGAILDVWPGAMLELGANVKIMQYVVIGVRGAVTIHDGAQIAEFSSVRDSNHGIDQVGSILNAPMVISPIQIGADCWVGRGCAILAGANLGAGAVVGANSVVRTSFAERAVVAGAPARLLRYRGRNAAEPES